MSRNDSCNSQHTLDQQSPQTPVHASCLESKAHPPNTSAHVDTAPLRPQSSNLMWSWRCIPVPAQTTIAHLVPVMRSISAHAPHPVLIMCASRTTSAYPQLQASSWPPSSYSPSRPTHLYASHARWFTASRCVSLHVSHSLVMTPLALSVKSAIAAVTSVSSSSSKSPSAMW